MFSKSLFKQSCKANGVMWIIITVAVCFMLCCVMLIAGNGSLGETKVAIENTVIKGELTAQAEQRAVNYYDIADGALDRFDGTFKTEFATNYATALQAGYTAEQAAARAQSAAYAKALLDLESNYYPALVKAMGYDEQSAEAQEIKGVIFYVLNPMTAPGTYMFDEDYKAWGEAPPRYDELLPALLSGSELYPEQRGTYVMNYSSMFLAGNLIKDENINMILDALSSYGVTKEQFDEFGFGDYAYVKSVAQNVTVEYRARLAYRLANMNDGETPESVKAEVKSGVAQSLLASLPKDVADALQEIGQADLYGTLVGSIFFKMAGLLLPIIYMIMSANALIAGQVDSGSMAYILSSGTKRREVTFTQSVYLITSLLAMFLCTTLASVICFAIVDVGTMLTYGKLLLINLGAFLVMFAMSGICFFASCRFNRSKHSMALGGGLNMFFLVATMLGLFGSPVLPSIIRMSALNAFNYVSIISLFDVVSILDGTLTFLWKWAILAVIGIACYVAGAVIFDKKDLPL